MEGVGIKSADDILGWFGGQPYDTFKRQDEDHVSTWWFTVLAKVDEQIFTIFST